MAVFLYKCGIMNNMEIRQVMVAFDVACRQYSADGIPLKVSKILKALKMANRIMSAKCVEMWIEQYKPYLYCNEWYQMEPKLFEKKKELLLYPHEFLILSSRCKNYLGVLNGVLSSLMKTKLDDKNVNVTLKKTEVNGFVKFIQNEVSDEMNANLPPKSLIRCSDLARLKTGIGRHFHEFKIMDDWENEILARGKKEKRVFKFQEIAEKKNEKNNDLAMRHVIGKNAADRKKDVDYKYEVIKSLYSLRGTKPPFITEAEYLQMEYKPTFVTATTMPPIQVHTTRERPIIVDSKPKNFIKSNMELTKYHPINKMRITMMENCQTQRPATTANSVRKLSYCSTAPSRGIVNRMNSIFNEEIEHMEKLS